MVFPDTSSEYKKIERDPIQYTYCVDYNHISRYKNLRQVIHQGKSSDRFIALETSNEFTSNCRTKLYTVPADKENRLDLIAYEQLGSATYAWVIAYFNGISDGFSVLEGTTLRIPISITELFNNGDILSSITATKLNLGSE